MTSRDDKGPETEALAAEGLVAAVVAVGTELLGEDRLDTNSLRIAAALRQRGIPLVFKSVVGDELERLVKALAEAAEHAQLVIVTGGLGPTEDDRTRAAVAALTGRELRRDPEVLGWVEDMYRRRGATMPTTNARQADVLEGSTVLPNERGTAPGLRFEHQGVTFFLLPGVPYEADGLLDSAVAPWLEDKALGHAAQETEMRVACLPESLVEERLSPLYQRFGAERIAVLARPGEVTLRLSGSADERRELERGVHNVLGDAVFSVGEHRGRSVALEQTVVEALAGKQGGTRVTLATAESCTGGLIGQRLTAVPGASAVYLGGVVSYANEAKTGLLNVAEELIAEHGAVSAEVAAAMAVGAREALQSDCAVSVTGVAGPGGGSEAKPVGTVWFGLSSDIGVSTCCLLFPGDRERIRQQASQFALDLVRRQVLGLPPLVDSPWMVHALETSPLPNPPLANPPLANQGPSHA